MKTIGGGGVLWLTRNPKIKDSDPVGKDFYPACPDLVGVTSNGHYFSLPRCFAASSSHLRSFSHAESSRRNSPRSSGPYPPAYLALPGSRPPRRPANTPKSARTPSSGPSSPSADRGHSR